MRNRLFVATLGCCAFSVVVASAVALTSRFRSGASHEVQVDDVEAASIWGGELCLNSGVFVSSGVNFCSPGCVPIYPLLLNQQGTPIRYKYSTFAYCWDVNTGLPGTCGYYQDFVGCNGSQPPPFPIGPQPPE